MTGREKEGLVDRLRSHTEEYLTSSGDHIYEHPPICTEAADALTALKQENERLETKLGNIETCACNYDAAGEVCLHHSPMLVAAEDRAAIADRNRDAARSNFLTMQQAADTLRKRAETAETKLAMLLEFVHRWTWAKEGNGTSDAERLDVIKHYPLVAAYNRAALEAKP